MQTVYSIQVLSPSKSILKAPTEFGRKLIIIKSEDLLSRNDFFQ